MKTTVQRLQLLVAAIEAEAVAIEAISAAAKAAKAAKTKYRKDYQEALIHDFDFPMEVEIAIYAEDTAKAVQQEASAYLADMIAVAKYHLEGVVAAGGMQ